MASRASDPLPPQVGPTDVPEAPSPPRLLLAEASGEAREATRLALERAGYAVHCVAAAADVPVQLAPGHGFAVVVADPAFFVRPLHDVRSELTALDAALPVLFVAPSARGGARRPAWSEDLGGGDAPPVARDAPSWPVQGSLHELLGRAVLQREQLLAQQKHSLVGGHVPLSLDSGKLAEHFAEAVGALYMAYQPIVDGRDGSVFGVEALVRSTSKVLSHPGLLFDAAEQLGTLRQLGRQIRDEVGRDIDRLSPLAAGPIFVNLHTRDLRDEALYDPAAPLSRHAARVVLEITERHALEEVPDVGSRVAALRAMGFRVAIDDLGAGYAGLTSLTQLEPEVVKLDMALVRDVQGLPVKRKVVAALAALCRELNILVIAEGIETLAEREVLLRLGIDYLQGYYFGRPERGLSLASQAQAFRWPTIAPQHGPPCACGSVDVAARRDGRTEALVAK